MGEFLKRTQVERSRNLWLPSMKKTAKEERAEKIAKKISGAPHNAE